MYTKMDFSVKDFTVDSIPNLLTSIIKFCLEATLDVSPGDINDAMLATLKKEYSLDYPMAFPNYESENYIFRTFSFDEFYDETISDVLKEILVYVNDIEFVPENILVLRDDYRIKFYATLMARPLPLSKICVLDAVVFDPDKNLCSVKFKLNTV